MVDKENVLRAHKVKGGKLEVFSKVPLVTRDDLSAYYTPGVATVCEEIHNSTEKVFEYTNKSNSIAIVSDGTRILGLGNIGPEAGLPVMEGKAILFKKFGGVDAIPLCISATNEDEIINIVKSISPTFGAINIEDIESPKSFRVVEKLSASLSIPVFHDDQQGTGVVALAALLNAIKLAGKDKNAKIIINGAGSAGMGIVRLLTFSGFKNVYVVDSAGAIYDGRGGLNEFKQEIARTTNHEKLKGNLDDLVSGADVLIGVSKAGAFTQDMIRKMNEKPIVFALANPIPEISYDEAKKAGAYIVATGRSDTPNQVNNLLAFPGICKGLLEVRAKGINYEMLYSASIALSKVVGQKANPELIIPDIMDPKLSKKIAANLAAAVAESAMKTGMSRIEKTIAEVKKNTNDSIKRYSKIEKKILKF
jgi:malate dehydrogenase (oxaloacetate-decarboxylating)